MKMSLYNLINGHSLETVFLMPMLSLQHPNEWPRFRDCWVENDLIHVYTRVGGINRMYYNAQWLCSHPDFVETYDDINDSTYGVYVFNVPKWWQADYELIKKGKLSEISDALKNRIEEVFPLLKEKMPWHSKEMAP